MRFLKCQGRILNRIRGLVELDEPSLAHYSDQSREFQRLYDGLGSGSEYVEIINTTLKRPRQRHDGTKV
jgi:hypothetical protein